MYSCPLCRAAFTLNDLKIVRLEFNSTSCDGCESSNEIVKSLQGALEEKEAQISKLQAELESLQLKQSENVSGSRIHLNVELKDSNCYNCESKEHNSVSCPNPPYLRYFKSFILRKINFCLTFKLKLVEVIICAFRFTETTKYEKWAPIQKFKVISKLPFDSENAGCMISYFTKKLNIRKPTRVQIQAFIGFSFFDDCCWRCASPFHHRGDCKNDDKGIKGLCKLLHEVNHPLTAEALAAKEYYRGR